MEQRIAQMADADERTSAEAWLTWARQHAADVDPLNVPFAMPAIPAPSAENLMPYLGHRSFYGPSRW